MSRRVMWASCLALLVALPALSQTEPQPAPANPAPAAAAPAPAPAPATQQQPAAPPATAVGGLIMTRTVPFRQGEPIRLDIMVGPMRVPELRITRDEANLLEQVLPPRGGVSRFSYLRYGFSAENPTGQDWKLAVRVRLLDRNNAVIDEFEFRRDVDAGRARVADIKRLTLNYAIPLIDRIEATFSAER